MESLSSRDYWRAIVLYGLNTATYKIALAKCLHRAVTNGSTEVSHEDLAQLFLDEYVERGSHGRPQLAHPSRITVMERIVSKLDQDLIDRDRAVQEVANQAFDDVIPAFLSVVFSTTPYSPPYPTRERRFQAEKTAFLLLFPIPAQH